MIQVNFYSHSKNSPRTRLLRWQVKINERTFFLDSIVPLSGESLTIINHGEESLASASRAEGMSPFKVEREVLRQMSETAEPIRALFNWGEPT